MLKQPEKFKPSSFHGTTIRLKPSQLIDYCTGNNIIYYECNTGENKTNYDFDFETKDGTYFTVYDWKEYRTLGLNEVVNWHIGGVNKADTEVGRLTLSEIFL